jgi:hypothetical protein
MNFFQNCATVEEIKSQYKKLARQYHPDLGGDTATMQALNNAYEAALKGCNGQKSKDSQGTEHTYKYNEVVEREIVDFIYAFNALNLPLQADLIGVWIWITGDTKPHKETLKSLKCRWHSKRGCWYFRPESYKGGWSSDGSLEELATKYGCQKVSNYSDKFKSRKKLK